MAPLTPLQLLEAPVTQQTVLRIKRTRGSDALDRLTVELAAIAPASKRPRTDQTPLTALRTLSLSATSKPPSETKRRVTFRRVDPTQPGPRAVICKARVVDISQRALRRVGPSSATSAGFETEVAAASSVDTDVRLNNGYPRMGAGANGAIDDNVCGFPDQRMRGTFTCNGVEMVRDVNTRVGAGGDAPFVYDIYVREERGELAQNNTAVCTDDDGPLDRDRTERIEAVVLASDLPDDVRFCWDNEGLDEDSSDNSAAADPALVDDLDDSEGSIDYPSTPDEDAYIGEVVSEADSDSDASSRDECSTRRRRCGQREIPPLFGSFGLLDESAAGGRAGSSPNAFGSYRGVHSGDRDSECDGEDVDDDNGYDSDTCY
jgi:hypothetical protein